jgi:hypothetical protein
VNHVLTHRRAYPRPSEDLGAMPNYNQRAMKAPLVTLGVVIYEGELIVPSADPRISR